MVEKYYLLAVVNIAWGPSSLIKILTSVQPYLTNGKHLLSNEGPTPTDASHI